MIRAHRQTLPRAVFFPRSLSKGVRGPNPRPLLFGKRGGVVHISREATLDDILKVCKVNEPKKVEPTPLHPTNPAPAPKVKANDEAEMTEEEKLFNSIGAKRINAPFSLSSINPDYELSRAAVYDGKWIYAIGERRKWIPSEKGRAAIEELESRGLEKYAFNRNCQRCVPTYEARCRGWNVKAHYTFRGDLLPYKWSAMWKNRNAIGLTNYARNPMKAQIEEIMKGWGDGARAEIAVDWKNKNDGHVFVAEQRNGKTHFIDPQTGSEDCSEYFDRIKTRGAKQYILRIDNNEFTELAKECFTPIQDAK